MSDDYEGIVRVGTCSIAKLTELSGYTGPVADTHSDKVDPIIIRSKNTKRQLKRIEDV